MPTLGDAAGQWQCESCKKWFTSKEISLKYCPDCAQKMAQKKNLPIPPNKSPTLNEQFGEYIKGLKEKGYFDDKGNLRRDLVVESAKMVARVLANADVASHQLRRFFNMSRNIEERLKVKGDFGSFVPEIAKMQPFAASVLGREPTEAKRKTLEPLFDFIDTNIQKATESEKAFTKGFIEHFESVMGYFKMYKPK